MFTSVFGISIKYEAWNHQDSLPVYIAGSYDFHTAYIGGYYGAAEPPVRCGESHLSGLTEPPQFVY